MESALLILESVWLKPLIILSGVGHFGLCIGPFAIPRVMNWQLGLAGLRTDLRKMFWVYAAYIWVFHIAFGALSIFAVDHLLDHSVLAAVITGFIAVYWGARIGVQFFYFERSELASSNLERAGLYVLEFCFLGWALVYGAAALINMMLAAGAP